jgi:hypothetical protein
MVGWNWKLAKPVSFRDDLLNKVRVNKMKVHLIAAMILSFAFVSEASSIIYVDANSPSNPGTGTSGDPFRRIQDAIDDSKDGDVVEIRPGLYSGYGNYDLNPAGKSITIRSTEGLNTAANTIIDPSGAGRGFSFYNGEDPNCILSGLTIRNGHAESDSGGGIYISNDSSPLITHCIIENNTADLYGGGIYCYFSIPKITDCIIRGNRSTEDGGGVEVDAVDVDAGAIEIENCIIADNQASGFGGGIDCYSSYNVVLMNCTLAGNSADAGGGLCCVASGATVKNCILWKNEASQGPEIALMAHYSGGSVVTVNYSDVRGGLTAIYNPAGVLVWGNGNINNDPCFVSVDLSNAPNTWDFHLQSAYGRWNQNTQTWVIDPNTSLCIDGGDPNSNWSGEPWPNGKRINMGAYGGTGQASKNGNPADFNVDNTVNFADFAQMAEQWLVGQPCIEDLNHDGKVDSADLIIFAENWLWHKN